MSAIGICLCLFGLNMVLVAISISLNTIAQTLTDILVAINRKDRL